MLSLIESWDTYQNNTDLTRRWVYQFGNGGQLSSGSLLMDGSTTSYCNTHIGALRSIRIGLNITPVVQCPTISNSSFLHLLQGGETNSNNQVGFGINPDGTLSVFYGSNFSGLGGTTLANGTTALATGVNYWVEVDVQLSTSTTGSVTVKINGSTEIALTGIRTSASNYPWVERVSLVGAGTAKHLFGALYIGDGAEGWLGPADVVRITLAGDTAQKDFAVNSGTSNYPALNDLNTATTYVASSALSASDLYTLSSLSSQPSSVYAVQVGAEALQNDSTNLIKALQPVAKLSGSSVGRGAVVLPATLPATVNTEPRAVYSTTPSGSAWSASALSSLNVGFRVAPFVKGFDFRATAAYVTDPKHCTYVLNDVYPTTRGGVTFGWNTAGTGTTNLDRTTANAKYAGVNCQLNNGTQRTFRIDVPAAGRYQLRMIIGDASFAQRQIYCQVKDGSTVLFTIDSTANPSSFTAAIGAGVDAQGWYNFALSSWESYNAPREITLTGTVLNITIGSPASGLDYTCLAHVELVALDLVNTLTTQSPEVRVAALYVEALVSQASVQAALAQPQVFVCT